MTIEVHALRDDAAAWYSGILDEVTAVLPSSLDRARQFLEPIAGEVWMGTITLHGPTTAGSEVRCSRRVADRTRAEVFLRDGFVCTYCGGRTIPRCILVAISDVFPDDFPYYAHYRRGTVHPAYWALAPEADHVLAHAGGGSSEPANLTTLHAMCNTRKSSLDAASLPVAAAPAHDSEWDGLLSRYAGIVAAGENTGTRGQRGDDPSYPRHRHHAGRPAERPPVAITEGDQARAEGRRDHLDAARYFADARPLAIPLEHCSDADQQLSPISLQRLAHWAR